jgi:aspartate/methionine/tyrosine aminotransferase
MQWSHRLENLGANVFAEMDRAKAEALAAGRDLIDLSLGSSDLPTPAPVLETISAALADPRTHGYLLHRGTLPFRETVARWYARRFGLGVDPETEVLPLIGSQEGTAHLPLAILNHGDYALLQDPGYPSHYGGIHLAGGQIYGMPLLAENQFLPIFADIPKPVLAASKMMVLSYPHNPTTAIAPLEFLESAVKFCQLHNLVLVHDFPYLDLVFEGGLSGLNSSKAPSILQADPERTVSIEFFTLSKSYNMGGFRVGFAVGNGQLIQALRQVKAVVDFNQYQGIMRGAIAALSSPDEEITKVVNTFQHRRDVMVKALHKIGWEVPAPEATMYIWAKLDPKLGHRFSQNSVEFCLDLVQSTGVALSPGTGFGKCGEGYVRMALVHPPEDLEAAALRIGNFS